MSTALVTGASSGIGREFARLLAARGDEVVLVARNAQRLDELAAELNAAGNGRATAIPCDLADPDAPARLVRELEARGIVVDTLVNNAGFGTFGAFADLPLDGELRELQVNVVALTALTGLLVPAMRARRRGGILNVASTAAFLPGPWMSVYYATKAYVLSFSEALAEELRPSGVRVTCLCPGQTATEFFTRAEMESSGLAMMMKHADPREVAALGLRALDRGTTVAIPGLTNRALPFILRLAPRRIVPRIVAKLQGPRSRR